jgi:nanoRNase/pAp phosphatase (c-di-AMP/oligoRNAs hydrolase)
MPIESSERIARLKAAKRRKLVRVNGWLVAFSHVSAYQASSARAMVSLGAHVAVVAGSRGEKVQISLRASPDFYKKTGVHLGKDIARPLGEYLNGMGGGHSLSAGVNGVGDVEAASKRCLRLLKERLM